MIRGLYVVGTRADGPWRLRGFGSGGGGGLVEEVGCSEVLNIEQ